MIGYRPLVACFTGICLMLCGTPSFSDQYEAIETALYHFDLGKVLQIANTSPRNRDIVLEFAALPNGNPDDPRNLKLLAELLSRGADPNSKIVCGPAFAEVMTWPHFDPSVAALMLNHGAKLNADAMLSAAGGGLDRVQWLVARGGDINARDESGNTPIFVAAEYDYRDEVEYLIRHGAKLDVVNNEGMTPLLQAAESSEWCSGAVGALHLLIAHGANVNAYGTGRMTALMYLSHRGGPSDPKRC